MACAHVDMGIHDYENLDGIYQRDPTIIQQHHASEMMPANKEPLHDLLQKQPVALGYLQMMSGLLNVGAGILFSITCDIGQSLFTLFRVSQLTGTLFFLAGLVCNLLFIYPALLTTSIAINCGCIIVAVVAACLISVDLAHWNLENDDLLKMEVLELCVMGFEVFISAILCFWFSKEKIQNSNNPTAEVFCEES